MTTQASIATGRRRAKRLPAAERRRQILDAAVKVFARHGYAGASTAEVAAAAGIGEPTIYRYFANKHHLFMEALKRTCGEIKENWERIAAGSSDPLMTIRLIGRWYYEQLSQRPQLLLLRFRSFTESTDPEVLKLVRDSYRDLAHFVKKLYEQAKAEGKLGPDADPHSLAWLFMARGALLDVTELLGLRDEVGPREMERIRQLTEEAVGTRKDGS